MSASKKRPPRNETAFESYEIIGREIYFFLATFLPPFFLKTEDGLNASVVEAAIFIAAPV